MLWWDDAYQRSRSYAARRPEVCTSLGLERIPRDNQGGSSTRSLPVGLSACRTRNLSTSSWLCIFLVRVSQEALPWPLWSHLKGEREGKVGKGGLRQSLTLVSLFPSDGVSQYHILLMVSTLTQPHKVELDSLMTIDLTTTP